MKHYIALLKHGVIYKILFLDSLKEIDNYEWEEYCDILNPRHQILFSKELSEYFN